MESHTNSSGSNERGENNCYTKYDIYRVGETFELNQLKSTPSQLLH